MHHYIKLNCPILGDEDDHHPNSRWSIGSRCNLLIFVAPLLTAVTVVYALISGAFQTVHDYETAILYEGLRLVDTIPMLITSCALTILLARNTSHFWVSINANTV